MKRILKKAGLTEKRKRRKVYPSSRIATGLVAEEPNQVWTIDFKGWRKSKEGIKVEPLTIRDEFSKKIVEIRLMKSTKTAAVQAVFAEAFENMDFQM